MKNFFKTLGHLTVPSIRTRRKRLSMVCGALLAIAFSGAADAQGTGYWHTSGSQIVDENNKPVRIAGVNWYGFETADQVVHGLWAQDYHTILDTIHGNGYNVVRLPFSNQMVEKPKISTSIHYGNASGPINSDLQGRSSLEILDKVIAYAGQIGLRVILDDHRSSAGDGTETGLWYTSVYPESSWIQDWKVLARRYLNNTTVIGVDLRNEPHSMSTGGACWDCGGNTQDWHLAAERGGNAVLSVNPKLLIFVEGTDCESGNCYWWGGNLQGVQRSPVTLSVANRLVYSAHDYGPVETAPTPQSWFNGSTTYSSLSDLWTKNWGYISLSGIAPVWVGEFGTPNASRDVEDSLSGSQGQWFQSLVRYLSTNSNIGWTYWALNGEDLRYGLLDSYYDPSPQNSRKQQFLAGIQFALQVNNGTGAGGTPIPAQAPAAPSNLSASSSSSNQINLVWAASATAGATYNVYVSTSSGFQPSGSTRLVTSLTATSFQQQGLSPSTVYYYKITAVNAGGESAPSNEATAVTRFVSASGAACQVSLSVASKWQDGFNANLSITNTGTTAINGWTLGWTWPGNQKVSAMWNAGYTQAGANVTVTNADFNRSIPVGSSVTQIGFTSTYSGVNSLPTVFYLNGARCANGNAHTRHVPDFDGDGRPDYAVWRPVNGTWFVIPTSQPTNQTVQQWGLPGDIPVAGDYDGDGKTDHAVWRPWNGTWYIIPSSKFNSPVTQQWGLPGDVPVPGDFDGDGKVDYAVWRPWNGTWYIIPSSNPSSPILQQWGLPGDVPVPGDFDGDGQLDYAVWRPSNGSWYIIPSSNPNSPIVQQWGLPGDIPVPGDFDGDGRLDYAVWRPSNGSWYVIPSGNPTKPVVQQWGLPGDVPVPGDFDNDGKLDYAVWRPSNGYWFIIPSSTPTGSVIRQWGLNHDTPVQGNAALQ